MNVPGLDNDTPLHDAVSNGKIECVKLLISRGASLSARYLSLVVRKPIFVVSDPVTHKPGCTATEDSKRLEISYLGTRGIVLSV